MEVTRNSCRVCLAANQENDYTVEDVTNYRNTTGFEISPEDLPRKICKNCCFTLQNFSQFKDDCKLVEERLQCVAEIKEEPDFEVFTEAFEEVFKSEADEEEEEALEVKHKIKKERKIKSTNSDTSGRPFQCDMCDRAYLSKCSLRKHRNYKHRGKVALLECFYCVEVFDGGAARKAHIDEVHKNRDKNQSFVCPYCGKLFKSKEYLKRHQENTHEDALFYCDLCDCKQAIRGKVRLYEHMRYRHIKPPASNRLPCHICGRLFHHSSARKVHVLRAHTDPKLWPFKCSICGRRYVDSPNFKVKFEFFSYFDF